MDPLMNGHNISGGVPVLLLLLNLWEHQLVQNVLEDPVRQQLLPALQQVHQRGAVPWRPRGEDLTQLGHPDIPDQLVVGVHAAVDEDGGREKEGGGREREGERERLLAYSGTSE